MNSSISRLDGTYRATAAGIAATVAVTLFLTPGAAGSPSTPAMHAPATAVHGVAVELTATTLNIDSTATTPVRNASAIPQASVTGQDLQDAVTRVALTAALIAVTPVWYAAFPITIPVSIALAASFDAVVHILHAGTFNQPEALTILGLALAGWAVGPIYVVSVAVKATGAYLNSLGAQADASQPTASATVSQILRQTHQPKNGLAGSRRTGSPRTNADRTPSPHRTATETAKHPDQKKRPTNANSGRGISKRTQS